MKSINLSEDEYISAAKLFLRPAAPIRHILMQGTIDITMLTSLVWNILVIINFPSANYQLQGDFSNETIKGTLIISTIWPLLYFLFISPHIKPSLIRTLRNNFREDPSWQDLCNVTWTTDYVYFTSDLSSSRTPWARIRNIREDATFILLYLSTQRSFTIPKNRFESDSEMADFMSHLSNTQRI